MSMTPADYLEYYNACIGHTSARVAHDMGVSHKTALIRLTRLESAGYIRRNADGLYQQATAFDAHEVNRLVSHGWTK